MSNTAQHPRTYHIPKAPQSKKLHKYRSPDPSPLNIKTYEQNANENLNLKENFNLVTRVNRKHSLSSAGPPLSTSSLLKAMNRENIENLEEFICKYHPALAGKNLQVSKQEHERIQAQNKNLKVILRQKQEELQDAIQERRTEVNRDIKKVENEIELLKLQLAHVKNHQTTENTNEILRLVKENSEFEKKI